METTKKTLSLLFYCIALYCSSWSTLTILDVKYIELSGILSSLIMILYTAIVFLFSYFSVIFIITISNILKDVLEKENREIENNIAGLKKDLDNLYFYYDGEKYLKSEHVRYKDIRNGKTVLAYCTNKYYNDNIKSFNALKELVKKNKKINKKISKMNKKKKEIGTLSWRLFDGDRIKTSIEKALTI